jgi:Ni2+-binding GTPase involved in maturation of urease and hydrogenase
MKKAIPITLITGYLGSGKTTLLNNILRNNQGYKVAVIVNDIGEVNIDADIIAKDGIVSGKEESLLSLENGCICCTLRTDLLEQIQEIIETKKFEVKTPEVTIKVKPECSELIQTKVIDGTKYLLIRADGDVEVNGIRISINE